MAKEAKPHVKKYLRDIQVAEGDIPDTVMDTLNGLDQAELDAVKKVGDAVTVASGGKSPTTALAKVH